MLKDKIRSLCQQLLGYRNYLFIFSLFSIKRVQWGVGHEKEFLHFLDLIPGEEGVILDIGANIGVMTVTMALKRRNATIFSFEPIPDNQEALEKVISYYQLKNVQVFKTALGDESGEINMVVPVVGNSNMQGLSHVVEPGTRAEGAFFSVPVQRLDDITAVQAAKRILAVKIDVENFEYYVLKGGSKLLTTHKPVIYCELWDNERRVLCMDYLKQLGYQVKIYGKNGLVNFTGQEVGNFFFIPA